MMQEGQHSKRQGGTVLVQRSFDAGTAPHPIGGSPESNRHTCRGASNLSALTPLQRGLVAPQNAAPLSLGVSFDLQKSKPADLVGDSRKKPDLKDQVNWPHNRARSPGPLTNLQPGSSPSGVGNLFSTVIACVM